MASKRGRTITDFGQMFGNISGAYIPPIVEVESLGWLGINQTEKLNSNYQDKLYSSARGKLSVNIRGR